jgi:hypothetical protein
MSGVRATAAVALESANKSPKKIKSYLASARSLPAFLRPNDMTGDVIDVTSERIRAS